MSSPAPEKQPHSLPAIFRHPVTMAGLLLLGLEALLHLAPQSRASLAFDVGPATGGEVSGFTQSWEYASVTARFAGAGATLRSPLVTEGGEATLVIRAAQLLDTPVHVHVAAGGSPLCEFEARPAHRSLAQWQEAGRPDSPFRELHIFRLPVHWPPGPFRLQLETDDPERSALAVDSVAVEGARWRVPLGAWAPRALVVGGFGVALLAGLTPPVALGTGALMAGALGAWAALDPFAMVHATARFAWPALCFSALLAVVVRRRAGISRWLVLPFLAGYVIKGALLFHPAIYWPDALQHYRYLAAFEKAEGSLAERGRAAQALAHSGYRRVVPGRLYAMPYSPLYYLPFTGLLPDRDTVEDAMRQVSLAAAAAEVAVVFSLGTVAFGARAGLWAAVLAAFLPPLVSRLLYAMWPTVFGHLLDTLAVLATLRFALRPSARRLGVVGGIWLAALLSYISSLFTLGAFAVALAALSPRRYGRVFLLAVAASVLTVLALYTPFVRELITEILPALWRGAGSALGDSGAASPTRAVASGLTQSFARIPIFFGVGYPLLAAGGLLLARKAAAPEASRVLAAHGLAVIGLCLLKGVSLGLFKDVKEVEFAGPLFAVTAGLALDALAARDRVGQVGAVAIAAALVTFGLACSVEYVTSAVWLAR